MEWLYILIGLAVGMALVFIAVRGKTSAPETTHLQQLLKENKTLSGEVAMYKERSQQVLTANQQMKGEIQSLNAKINGLTTRLAVSDTENAQLRKQHEHNKNEMEQIRNQLNNEFKNLANALLEEKATKMVEHNRQSIDQILSPFKEKLLQFEIKTDRINKESISQNAALKQQLEHMLNLNRQMSEEAQNLTRALKGDNKQQGNWGEMILEKVLEKSGLIRGREYDVQEVVNHNGRKLQPDVVIHLPGDKKIIVDAKVSLLAYEKMVTSENQEDRNIYLKQHLQSVRGHIKNICEKNYQELYGLQSLDFILLFLPLEPAFSVAVMEDHTLFTEAYEKNVVLVSPTTLMATLRTIANIWRQEYQNMNAHEIAKLGGELHDKFVGFANDMIKIGSALEGSQKAYDTAMKKLSEGKGNLVGKARKLHELGAVGYKNLDKKLINNSNVDE